MKMTAKEIIGWMRKHWIVTVIVLGILGVLGWYFFLRTTPVSTAAPEKVSVERGDLKIVVTGSGQIEARSQVDLKSVIAGDGADVLSVQVKNDQEVKKGQVIATIDATDAARDVQSAQLNVQSAEIKMKQVTELYSNKTKEDTWERDAQELAVKESKISLAQARKKLSDYTVRAPFDGIVTGLSVEAGDSLANDTVLASVITKDMQAAITLNEVDAAKVKKGEKVTLALDALPDVKITGSIEKIDTIGTVTSGVVTYGALITLDEQNEALLPGMSVTAEIAIAEQKDVLMVPNEAVTSEDGKSFVRVVTKRSGPQDDTNVPQSEKKEIKTGITNDVMTEVVSGLNEGEMVIIGSGTQVTAASRNTNPLTSLFGGGQRRTTGGSRP